MYGECSAPVIGCLGAYVASLIHLHSVITDPRSEPGFYSGLELVQLRIKVRSCERVNWEEEDLRGRICY